MGRKHESDKSFNSRVLARTGVPIQHIPSVPARGDGYYPEHPAVGYCREEIECTRVRPDGRRETVFGLVCEPSWSPQKEGDYASYEKYEEDWNAWYDECDKGTRFVRVVQ